MPDLSIALRRSALFGRRLAGALAARVSGTSAPGRYPEVSGEIFRREISEAIDAIPSEFLSEHCLLHLPAKRAPWFDTGVDLRKGEQVTWIANGRTELSKLLDIYVEPNFQLWARVGDGDVFRGWRDTHTFTAANSGRLQLASYFPGQWSARDGSYATPQKDWSAVSGGMDVAVLRWAGAARPGLEAMAASGSGRASGELDRLGSEPATPANWRYLWFLGPGEIYQEREEEGRVCIDCHTHCDVGILRQELDAPLEPDTTLRWQWNVSELPSTMGEDLLPTHDYLSIAVEYDNGIDVTYYWSAELPVDEGYWCPLPAWKDREYHIVVRSGTDGLGQWHWEERNLFDDYQRYVGGAPARVVRVWLIANSLFQRGRGRCSYADISVGTSDDRSVAL